MSLNRANTTTDTRPRSNSVIKDMSSSQNSPSQSSTSQKKDFRRSMSISEGLHVKMPALQHSETADSLNYSPISQVSSHNVYPSESNWANKYEDFDIGKPIGYGSSAVVYEAIYKPLKKKVAVKMIDLDMFERNQIDELRRETALMALSKHPNVLRVYGSFVNGSKLYIVTPYLSAGSCLDIMKTSFPEGLDEISIASILRQALEGLVYLHKNGHIHRDVKAGNLLMDQYGTVLLADFGVSSSLTDNSDVRKTFVGTPCWMAPEVMEQAGYNYKADIWSFGITSLELATGHAPFAKYPPMKVLMMTLSNAPPTLDRENGKHKYSKAFKEMIDSCLQKDPSKRPSAEKLLTHPFFKQAKRRDYLIKSILQYVPPLDQRPHKKVPQKHIAFETTEQWDFDDDRSDQLKATTPVIAITDKSDPSPLSSANTTPIFEKPKSIQFEDCPKPIHVNKSLEEPQQQQQTPTKKHISFGDAVIKDPTLNRAMMSPVVENPSPIMNPSPLIQESHIILSSAPLSKKSRFVVEDQTNSVDSTVTSTTNTTINSSSTPIQDGNHGVGLGISTPTTEGEFKKGRFSVNQTPSRSPQDDSNTPLTEIKATPMTRVASQDSFQERKSRFEIKHTNTPSDTPIQSFPLTRENSNASALSRESSTNKISRFSVEKTEGPTNNELPPECRKKGRFELTGGTSDNQYHESPQSTSIGQSPIISPCNSLSRGQAHRILDSSNMVYNQLEVLIKQSEVQKTMLQDLLSTVHYVPTRSRTLSDSKRSSVSSHSEDSHQRAILTNDINSTIEHLQQLLNNSNKEKERLVRENESLRKEIERLRKNQLQPSQQQQQQENNNNNNNNNKKSFGVESPSSYLPSPSSLVAPEATLTTANNTNQQDKAL